MTAGKKRLIPALISTIISLIVVVVITFYICALDVDCILAGHDDQVEACTKVIHTGLASATPYLIRGGNYLIDGHYELALEDYDRAIEIGSPDYGTYALRGMTYTRMQKYDLAIADLNQALQLAPGTCQANSQWAGRSGVLLHMQEAYFLKGDFPAAIKAVQEVLTVTPNAELAMWLHIDRLRAGEEDRAEFARNSKAAKPNDWQAAALSFFAGTLPGDALIAKAANPDAKTQKGQICQANFYIGETLLPSDKAKPYFQVAMQTCDATSIYAVAAQDALASLP